MNCSVKDCGERGQYQVVTYDGFGAPVRDPKDVFCADHWWIVADRIMTWEGWK